MTDYAVPLADTGVNDKTLTPSVVDTVNFARACRAVEVTNLSGGDEIYVTTDGSVPTVAGGNAIVVPAGIESVVLSVPTSSLGSVVRLISATAQRYSVAWTVP